MPTPETYYGHPLTTQMRLVVWAAERVRPVWKVDPVIRELYGYASPVLDTGAMLRGVAAMCRMDPRRGLDAAQKDVALDVIECRFR